MSVLAHVVLGAQQGEPAATRALAYILNSNPDIARSFVGILQDANIEFEPGRIEAELAHEDGQPDLTIHDTDGRVRIFVENKFWAPLTPAQPVSYLKELPEDPPSALIFVVPGQRVITVWSELKDRCGEAGLEWADAPGESTVMRARVGCKTMSVTSWEYVLERLLDAARSEKHDTVRDDILQLRGLAGRMNLEAFLPLRDDEATDQETARRLINYVDLAADIIDELVRGGIADTDGLTWSYQRYATGHFFNIHAHGKFETRLGIHLKAWRDEGISPLWWRFRAKTGVVVGHFKAFPELLRDVRPRDDGLYVPIRLKTGVEREKVVSDAAAQIERIADKVLKTIPNG